MVGAEVLGTIDQCKCLDVTKVWDNTTLTCITSTGLDCTTIPNAVGSTGINTNTSC